MLPKIKDNSNCPAAYRTEMEWFTSPGGLLTQKSSHLSLQIYPYNPHWGLSEVSAACQELKCHSCPISQVQEEG